MKIVYMANTIHTFLSMVQVVQPEVYLEHHVCHTDEDFKEFVRNLMNSEFGFDKNFFPEACLGSVLFNKQAAGRGLTKRMYVYDTEDFGSLTVDLPTHYVNRYKWTHTFTVDVVDNNELFVCSLCEWNHGQMPYIPYTDYDRVDVEFDAFGVAHLFWHLVGMYHNNDPKEMNSNIRHELGLGFDDAEKVIELYNLRPLRISYEEHKDMIHLLFATYTKRCGGCIEFRIDGKTIGKEI